MLRVENYLQKLLVTVNAADIFRWTAAFITKTDLRHMATTILFLRGIPEAVIRKLTGHRSRELERYEHLSPLIKQQTVELIASELKVPLTRLLRLVAQLLTHPLLRD